MNKKIKIFSILTSIVLATSLAGCTAKESKKDTPDETFIALKSNSENKDNKDIYIKYQGGDFKKVVEKAAISKNMQYFPESKVFVYQDESKNVFMFENGKEKVQVAKDPSMVIVNEKKHVIYLDKNKNLYFKAYGKNETQIASNVQMARIAQNGDDVLYNNENNELFLSKGNNSGKKIGTEVQMFSFTDSKNKILITKKDGSIYSKELKENGKEEKIGSANECVFLNMDKDENVNYFKGVNQENGNYYGDFYYRAKGKGEVKIAEKVNCSPYEFQIIEGTIYYVNKDNKLFSAKLATNEVKEIGKDVVNFAVDNKGNAAFLNNKDVLTVNVVGKPSKQINSKNKFYAVYDGKVYILGEDKKLTVDDKLISENVEEIQLNKGNLAYYTTDNKLYLLKSQDEKGAKILENITDYEAIFYAGNILYFNKEASLIQNNPAVKTEQKNNKDTKEDAKTNTKDEVKDEKK